MPLHWNEAEIKKSDAFWREVSEEGNIAQGFKLWEEEDIALLKEYYSTLETKDLAKILKRTEKTIYRVVNQYGFRKRRKLWLK